jgi:hypothetical protein
VTDHADLGAITRLQPGTLVDVTIKGVQVEQENANGSVTIRGERGHCYPLPPQATVKRADLTNPIDAATLQERISKALSSIDGMLDEQTLDPWTAHWLRKTLDPNPRHWPPQAGDVWDDGMPFGASLWFGRNFRADEPGTPGGDRRVVVMVSVEGGARIHTPDELLESGGELKLVYRHKDGGQ